MVTLAHDKIITEIDLKLDKTNKEMATFDMRLLSVMFTGMQLQRTFGGFLRTAVTSFMAAEGHTSELRMKTDELWASWEFFKFSLIDALNTDWFIGILDGVISVIQWFGRLDEEVRARIVMIIAVIGALGTAMFLFAQIKLAWDAIFATGGLLAAKSTVMSHIGPSSALFKAMAALSLMKIAWDIGEFLTGKDDLESTIDDITEALGMFAIFTGNGWLAAISFAIRFRDPLREMGEWIENFARNMQEQMNQRLTSDGPFSFENVLLNMFQGSAAQGLGSIGEVFQLPDKAIDSVVEYADSLDQTAKNIDVVYSPAVHKQSVMFKEEFTPAVQAANEELNLLNTVTTDDFVNKSEERRTTLEQENEVLRENARLLERINSLSTGFASTRSSSSIFGD